MTADRSTHGARTGGAVHDPHRASRPSSGRDRAFRHLLADSTPVAAGGRAILLQIADPGVAAGVRRHSDFARRPQQRLAHTLSFVFAVVSGTAEDAAIAASFVNRAHVPVAGADDVDRQLWVAATLYDSARQAHATFGSDVFAARAEEVLQAYATIGTTLRVPPSRWPESVAAFDRYWAETLDRLTVTDDARGVVRDLLHPRFAPWWVQVAIPLVRIVTVGMLPDRLRADYGFAWGPRERQRYERAVRVLRVIRGLVPGWLLRLPGPLLVRAMRQAGRRRQPARTRTA
ncbi:MAG: oxygenase MpaB family protein [Curtobacterium sp.]